MTEEIRYDDAAEAEVIQGAARTEGDAAAVPGLSGGDGMGCHAGAGEMEKAARAAGKSEILDQYAKDYPQGPHDKPQSMCPAFGSLRVGLRMRRVATVLSGSACCVYGLTFVSHFYGARRSVGYVPFNSETLVTGETLRRHPRGRARDGRPTALRRDRGHQSMRSHGLGCASPASAG
jgi:3,8-divinyl chlorophyllide a/chlorophyllide a reductase subunit Y